ARVERERAAGGLVVGPGVGGIVLGRVVHGDGRRARLAEADREDGAAEQLRLGAGVEEGEAVSAQAGAAVLAVHREGVGAWLRQYERALVGDAQAGHALDTAAGVGEKLLDEPRAGPDQAVEEKLLALDPGERVLIDLAGHTDIATDGRA